MATVELVDGKPKVRRDLAEADRCVATTKDGRPCSSPRAKRYGLDVCLGHAPPEIKQASGFGSVVGEAARANGARGGRGNRRPRVQDIYREALEKNQGRLIRSRLDALKATKTAVDQESGTVRDSGLPDHAIRMRAAESLENRALGTPTQTVEATVGVLLAEVVAGGIAVGRDAEAGEVEQGFEPDYLAERRALPPPA